MQLYADNLTTRGRFSNQFVAYLTEVCAGEQATD
jgi:hypothetical protein